MEQPKPLYITLGRDSLPLNIFDAPTLMQLLAELTFVCYQADHLGTAPTGWRETLAGYEAAIKAWANYRERYPKHTSGPCCCYTVDHRRDDFPAAYLRVSHKWISGEYDGAQMVVNTFCERHIKDYLPEHDLDIIITL